jgi:predicted ferric reductase
MFLLIIIMIGLHRPKISKQSVVIIIVTACMWSLDRLYRFVKICWNLPGNHATITPVSDGAVRVKLNRNLNCKPGSHAFMWIPSLRFFETHPFTLISNKPAEFLVRPYDGFTSDLYKLAQKQPGKQLRCSLDGAYGQVPNFGNFDKVVLVAGGSGASFTFAIALDLVKKETTTEGTKNIDFIWAVKDPGQFPH